VRATVNISHSSECAAETKSAQTEVVPTQNVPDTSDGEAIPVDEVLLLFDPNYVRQLCWL
jgi:hypothetical protein